MNAVALFALLALSCTAMLSDARAAERNGVVYVTDIKGGIGVAATRQIAIALGKAELDRGSCLVLRLDTPGGLVTATREIVQLILASPIPVIVYVAPGGARAASAGTFIVYAAHVAAMAPGTNLGAATPVEIGGLPGLPRPGKPKQDGKDAPDTTPAAQQKAINDTVAMLRSLAQMRGRNVEWAEKAVREAATLTAEEALREGVIDIVARDLDDLLMRVDGRTVMIGDVDQRIATTGLPIIVLEPDWRTRALGIVSDPNVAFILLMIGIYGIILEFWSPGSFVPGVIGAICLIIALMALFTLPIQYAALALVLLGIGLMVGEAFTPSIGILGAGGLIAFIAGSVFLFDPAGADIDVVVSLPLIIAAAATSAALVLFVLGAAVKARSRPAITGSEEMIASTGHVVEWRGLAGRIRVHGEIWSARADRTLKPDEAVRIVQRDGLILVVEPLPKGDPDAI
jgi:membrane-bound serine protease (ClpP class)